MNSITFAFENCLSGCIPLSALEEVADGLGVDALRRVQFRAYDEDPLSLALGTLSLMANVGAWCWDIPSLSCYWIDVEGGCVHYF